MRGFKTILGISIFVSVFAAEFPLQVSTTPPSASGGAEEAALVVNLPKIYILPDSPLYFLKKIWEGVQLLLTTKPEERGEVLLSLAEKRLAEGIALIKKGSFSEAVSTLQNYQGQFENAQSTLALIKDIGKYEELRQQISRHLQSQALLMAFLEKIGAGEVLGTLKPKTPIGQLELKPVE